MVNIKPVGGQSNRGGDCHVGSMNAFYCRDSSSTPNLCSSVVCSLNSAKKDVEFGSLNEV